MRKGRSRKGRTNVIRRREDSDAKSVVFDGVASLSDLVRPNDGCDIIPLRPSPRHVWSETNSDTLQSISSVDELFVSTRGGDGEWTGM